MPELLPYIYHSHENLILCKKKKKVVVGQVGRTNGWFLHACGGSWAQGVPLITTQQCPSLHGAPSPRGGGGNAVAGIGKKCGKMRKKCGKCGKKCDRKCGFVRMVFAPRNPYVSSRLAQLGAQSMDGSMEQLSAVVQLKNIMDSAQNR